jgi:hypothetical protein
MPVQHRPPVVTRHIPCIQLVVCPSQVREVEWQAAEGVYLPVMTPAKGAAAGAPEGAAQDANSASPSAAATAAGGGHGEEL